MKYILRVAWMALVVCAAPSCVYDDEPSYDEDDDRLMVGFSIAVENTTPQSRGTADGGAADTGATWGDGYPAIVGSQFDSRIYLNTFRMAICKIGDGGSLEPFVSFGADQLLLISTLSSDGLHTVYHLTTFFKTDKPIEEIRSGAYRVMVWLNAPNPGAGTDTSGVLDDLSFESLGAAGRNNRLEYFQEPEGGEPAEDVTLDTFDRIPMWGCATVSLSGIERGKAFELQPEGAGEGNRSILLLRSMAKTSVEPDEELTAQYGADFKINSVTLLHARSQGYVMPAGWETLSDTRALEFGATARELRTGGFWNVSTDVLEPGGAAVLYLPEYINDDNRICLSVDYTLKGERAVSKIFFCRYENGKPLVPYGLNDAGEKAKYKNSLYDIVRNHHYRFIVGIDEAKAGIVVHSIRIEDWVYGGGGFLDPVE